jgi:hypothetical protein
LIDEADNGFPAGWLAAPGADDCQRRASFEHTGWRHGYVLLEFACCLDGVGLRVERVGTDDVKAFLAAGRADRPRAAPGRIPLTCKAIASTE